MDPKFQGLCPKGQKSQVEWKGGSGTGVQGAMSAGLRGRSQEKGDKAKRGLGGYNREAVLEEGRGTDPCPARPQGQDPGAGLGGSRRGNATNGHQMAGPSPSRGRLGEGPGEGLRAPTGATPALGALQTAGIWASIP